MKPSRQNVILEIIAQQNIETQNQLLDALAERGIKSTQATLSRDIKDMRLVKELGSDGNYRYVAPVKVENEDLNPSLKTIFRESLVSYDIAQNLLVLKTLPGLAPACCSAIDNMSIDGLVGTLAGDDTAFLAMRDNEFALKLYHEIEVLF
ncbi:MAG: arginine repressor [Candidatus Limivicinus sp.]|jgi:transcriptional regulator of arginine metabolism